MIWLWNSSAILQNNNINLHYLIKGGNDLMRKYEPRGRGFTEVSGFHRMTSSELSESGGEKVGKRYKKN